MANMLTKAGYKVGLVVKGEGKRGER